MIQGQLVVLQGKDCSSIARCCFGTSQAHMQSMTLPRCRSTRRQHTRRTPTVRRILGKSRESMVYRLIGPKRYSCQKDKPNRGIRRKILSERLAAYRQNK